MINSIKLQIDKNTKKKEKGYSFMFSHLIDR